MKQFGPELEVSSEAALTSRPSEQRRYSDGSLDSAAVHPADDSIDKPCSAATILSTIYASTLQLGGPRIISHPMLPPSDQYQRGRHQARPSPWPPYIWAHIDITMPSSLCHLSAGHIQLHPYFQCQPILTTDPCIFIHQHAAPPHFLLAYFFNSSSPITSNALSCVAFRSTFGAVSGPISFTACRKSYAEIHVFCPALRPL